jgi:hypothetical protein
VLRAKLPRCARDRGGSSTQTTDLPTAVRSLAEVQGPPPAPHRRRVAGPTDATAKRIIACDPGGLELLRLGWGGSPLLLFQGVFRVWSWVGGGRRILFFFSFQNVPWLNEELVKSVFDA